MTSSRPSVLGIEESELAMLLDEALSYRECGRFDRTPCREQPDIHPEKWCPWCRLAEAWTVVHA